MGELQELVEVIREVGPDNIWRPVYSPANELLAAGRGNLCNGLPNDLEPFDFKGKTVVDIGCNFGYYTFVVKRAGAGHITGIDSDNRIIRGCRILQHLFGMNGISFKTADVGNVEDLGSFHTGMMIDFIGKIMVGTGVMKEYFNSLESLSEKEMIITIKPAYHVIKHLNGDFHGLHEKYPEDYIRDNSFHIIDYVGDRFRHKWHMRIVPQKRRSNGADKELLHFTRK